MDFQPQKKMQVCFSSLKHVARYDTILMPTALSAVKTSAKNSAGGQSQSLLRCASSPSSGFLKLQKCMKGYISLMFSACQIDLVVLLPLLPGWLTTAERRAAPPPQQRPQLHLPLALPSWWTLDWTCPATERTTLMCRWEARASSWKTKKFLTPKRINSVVELIVACRDIVLQAD